MGVVKPLPELLDDLIELPPHGNGCLEREEGGREGRRGRKGRREREEGKEIKFTCITKSF